MDRPTAKITHAKPRAVRSRCRPDVRLLASVATIAVAFPAVPISERIAREASLIVMFMAVAGMGALIFLWWPRTLATRHPFVEITTAAQQDARNQVTMVSSTVPPTAARWMAAQRLRVGHRAGARGLPTAKITAAMPQGASTLGKMPVHTVLPTLSAERRNAPTSRTPTRIDSAVLTQTLASGQSAGTRDMSMATGRITLADIAHSCRMSGRANG